MSNDYVLFTDRVKELKKQERKIEGSRKSIKFTMLSFSAFKKSVDKKINELIEERILKDQQKYKKIYDGLEARINDSKIEVNPVKVGIEINRLADLSMKLTYMCDVLEKRRSKIENGKQPKKFKISSLSRAHIKQAFISKLYKDKQKHDVKSDRIGMIRDIQQQYNTVGNNVLDAIETNDLQKAREELGKLETYRTEWFKPLESQAAPVDEEQNLNVPNEQASAEAKPIEDAKTDESIDFSETKEDTERKSVADFMFGHVGIDPTKTIDSEQTKDEADIFTEAYDGLKNGNSQPAPAVDDVEGKTAEKVISDPLDAIMSQAGDTAEEKSESEFVSDASQSPMTKEDAYSLGEKAAEEVDIESLIRPNVEKQSVDNQQVGLSWQSTLRPTSDYLHDLSETSRPEVVATSVAQEETGASEVDQRASQVFEALKAAGLTPQQMKDYIDTTIAESMGESVDAPKRSM